MGIKKRVKNRKRKRKREGNNVRSSRIGKRKIVIKKRGERRR